MIDLETLGTITEAPVISIGACFFTETGIEEKFYAVLNVSEQIDSGKRKVDGATIKWWMGQEGAAKKVFKDDIGVQVCTPASASQYIGSLNYKSFHNVNKQILSEFVLFCNRYGEMTCKPWGNGSVFDITILESILRDYELPIPWKFRNIRDLRTFKEYVYDGAGMVFAGTSHNALDDAVNQAAVVIEGLYRQRKDTEITYAPEKLPLRQSFTLFLADFKARISK